MAVFPLFVDLGGKTCIVVGGGEVASRKVEILLRFDADLSIIAPEVSSSILSLEIQDKIKIFRKKYSEHDIDEAFLVVAATSDPEVNENVFRDAKKRNIPVNVVDDPEKCTFIFPSVVNRGDLTIGISTSGIYPVLSKKIRKITEEAFSEEYGGILRLLADFRVKVRKSHIDQPEKEKLLKQVIDEFYDNGVISHEALKAILDKHLSYLFRI
ncbi:MAG: bifunctional precorrin-2 dehydrogenase/sirohydrochlorin ferrochelatase [Ruminiclostridium sp.]|nr:bifunctional precorrin-2 dehydrogenase/sirohydrochlorin ferrochelatase [Ruminiclostridium sp.]